MFPGQLLTGISKVYSESCQTSRMDYFTKQFTTDRSTVNYFLKKLHLRQGYGHTSAFYKLDVSKSLNDLQENTSIMVNL